MTTTFPGWMVRRVEGDDHYAVTAAVTLREAKTAAALPDGQGMGRTVVEVADPA